MLLWHNAMYQVSVLYMYLIFCFEVEVTVQLSLLMSNESQLSLVSSEAKRSEVMTLSLNVGIKG